MTGARKGWKRGETEREEGVAMRELGETKRGEARRRADKSN